jgi:hypothetical protein
MGAISRGAKYSAPSVSPQVDLLTRQEEYGFSGRRFLVVSTVGPAAGNAHCERDNVGLTCEALATVDEHICFWLTHESRGPTQDTGRFGWPGP